MMSQEDKVIVVEAWWHTTLHNEEGVCAPIPLMTNKNINENSHKAMPTHLEA